MYRSIKQNKWIAGTPLFVCIWKIVRKQMSSDCRHSEGRVRLWIVKVEILYEPVLSGSLRM